MVKQSKQTSPPPMGHNGIAGEQLRSYIDRIENLEQEKKALADDIRDIYTEARLAGFDARTMRQVVRLRRQDAADREEQRALLELYMHSLGMLADTPLGKAAVTTQFGEGAGH